MKSLLRLNAATDPLLDFLVRGSFASLATRVIGLSLSYGSAVFLSRTLGTHGYGTYAIALSWALVLVLPSRAGLDYAALRLAPIYFEEGKLARLRALIRFSYFIMFWLSLLVGGVFYLLTIGGFTSASPPLATGMALLIFPLAALGLVAVLLRTARKIVASQFYEQVLRPSVVIACLTIAALVGAHLTPANAMMITSFGAFVAMLLGAFHVVQALGASKGPGDYASWQNWMVLSFPLFLTQIVQEVLNQVDIILLGYLDTPASAGIYSASWRVASLLLFGLAALTTTSGPLIASAHARDDQVELSRIARITARFAFIASISLALPLAIAGREILGIFGPGFGDGYWALLILLLGGLANGFSGVVAYFLTLTGRQMQALWIFLGALLVSAGLNLLLIPRFSITGAAAASASATIFWNVAMVVYVRRRLGIDSSAFGLRLGRRLISAQPEAR